MRKEEFSTQRDGMTIRGLAFFPEGDHLPIAVMSHGFTANYDHMVPHATWFAQHGFAAFCFDFNGGCAEGRSDDDTTKMSVFTEAEDLKAVIAYAQGRPETDAEDVTLQGNSQGGFVSALVAAEMPDLVKSLILFYPAFCIPDDVRKGRAAEAVFDPENIPDLIPCGPVTLGRCYAELVKDLHFEEMIRPYTGPVLILHGTEDDVVPPRYSEQAAAIYANATYCPMEGAGHGFTTEEVEKAFQVVGPFLQKVRDKEI